MSGDSPNYYAHGADDNDLDLLNRLKKLIRILIKEKKYSYNRVLSTADYFIDRWERAAFMGFGEGSSVYDSCLVLGDVKVGKNTWIGPYTILDGSGGGLEIGDNCNISAGVHIYTHDTVGHVINGDPIAQSPVRIGNNVYIGPHSVIAKGVSIGDFVVIGACSLVLSSIPYGMKAFGTPAKIVGKSINEER